MHNEVSPGDQRSAKRILLGDPLPTDKLEGQLLSKRLALPIFASDALSSVAYAPQELLMILMIGGLAFLSLAPWIAACVVILLLVVMLSYRQLIKAYPSGGGDYEVARKNLGETAGLTVAAALLVDYALTVAVSIASGVDNIISALPFLNEWRVEMAIGFVIILVAVNLRGVSESSKLFALPTYIFAGSVFLMIVVGFVRMVLGDAPVAESANYTVHGESLTQAAMVLLILRAFASGCSALTGVEAISNGVQAFRLPKIQNAQKTLVAMGGIAIVLFAGLTALALTTGVHYAEKPCDLQGFADCASTPQRSLIAQVASATFGDGSFLFFLVQAATALVLLLAANTAFNGFPMLGSVLARDGYAPKALNTRGDRLIYSNGVIILGLVAIGILLVFQANLTQLIQLYVIGVFLSFTLGQFGMVKHWRRVRRENKSAPGSMSGLLINGLGATLTLVVLLIVTVTKFTHGAWVVFVIMPILGLLMAGVHRYYRDVAQEIQVDPDIRFGSDGDLAVVLVGRLDKPTLKALDYARAAKHDRLIALHASIDPERSKQLKADWEALDLGIEISCIPSPYRDVAIPVSKFIKRDRVENGPAVVTVYMPTYIVGHWWERLLHNHRSRQIQQRLLLVHGVTVSLVPWLLDSSEMIYGRRSRPLPGDARRGLPQRPAPMRPAGARVSNGAMRLPEGAVKPPQEPGADTIANTIAPEPEDK
ncbi:APC family permease [Mycetocola sp. JXN-3]|uniref:APC family permease n=1 Tax=Mycetocola sp. JXN-3 TaxID=2116510 RepID=UPI00165CF91C|nr:APC family permease [Mycetocola sp. JXN-3]